MPSKITNRTNRESVVMKIKMLETIKKKQMLELKKTGLTKADIKEISNSFVYRKPLIKKNEVNADEQT